MANPFPIHAGQLTTTRSMGVWAGMRVQMWRHRALKHDLNTAQALIYAFAVLRYFCMLCASQVAQY